MIIISKEHDYYDKVLAYGSDSDLRFIREYSEITSTSEIPELLIKMLYKLPYGGSYEKLIIRPFIVIFCGHFYLGYRFYRLRDRYGLDYSTYVYDLDSLEKVLLNHDPDGYWGYLKKSRFSQFGSSFKKIRLLEMFQEYENKKIDIDIHLDQRAPILYIGYINFRSRDVVYKKNPLLRKLEFYKKIDAYTAFQELSMFIGGVVSKEFPPTVELEEKNKIMKRGFDKWSFRKMGKNSK